MPSFGSDGSFGSESDGTGTLTFGSVNLIGKSTSGGLNVGSFGSGGSENDGVGIFGTGSLNLHIYIPQIVTPLTASIGGVATPPGEPIAGPIMSLKAGFGAGPGSISSFAVMRRTPSLI